jgi:hypothetical protein
MDPSLETIWRFIRGDLSTEGFGQWLYAHPELESAMGASSYLALVSTDFRDPEAVRAARSQLEAFARSITAMSCECVSLPTTAVIDMADPGNALDHFREEVRRGDPGITVPELASLLNLDLETAAVIAKQAVMRDGVEIDLGCARSW